MMKQGAAAVRRDSEEDGEGRRVSSAESFHGEQGMFVQEEGDKSCFIKGRMSADSQDFEFDKLGGLTISSASSQTQCIEAEGVQKLASADELFYKGQLLPLQYSRTRSPSYTHSLTSSPITQLEDLSSKSAELPLSANSLIREQDTLFSSCRMDHLHGALDQSCLFELTRSSSFRSHSANYSSYYCDYYANHGPPCSNGSRNWDSFPSPSCTTTSGGECSSSSRDSNGSSQDSCISCPDACIRELQHAAGCSRHGQLLASAVVNRPCNTQRKPGFMQSWKSLFHGFKRGTQSAGAVGNHQGRHSPSFHGSLSRAATTAAHQGAGAAAAAACACKLSKEKAGVVITDQVARSFSRNTSSLMWAQGKDQRGKIKANQVINSADHRIISSDYSKKAENDHQERKGAASKGTRWQDYTRRIKPIIKATWHANPAARQTIGDRRHGSRTAGNYGSRADHLQEVAGDQISSDGVTAQALPLQRKFSQPSLVSTTVSGVKERFKVQVSFKFHGAVSRSCPASVKSSPNHSGLLVAAASPSGLFTPNMSAMQELHSAVQSAIAHCKQSVAAAAPPSPA